jgi:hypothetical protein
MNIAHPQSELCGNRNSNSFLNSQVRQQFDELRGHG